eukprot:CAMPEP_0194536962 /NCGR_PEP_ID=MMETSP0253-20130528/76066_1 /TAXON_ID=2966 /ORGANISM="Noctiluca scintillans" /LENGTH=255 /DNA_ID=CAMNT_0039382937 /DNA_START=145 /DNA_END=915 /DNA_ORIENTATION=+
MPRVAERQRPTCLKHSHARAAPRPCQRDWSLGASATWGPAPARAECRDVEASPPQRSPRGILRVYGEVRSGDGQLAPVSFNKNEGNREGGNGYGRHSSGGGMQGGGMRALWAEAEAATTPADVVDATSSCEQWSAGQQFSLPRCDRPKERAGAMIWRCTVTPDKPTKGPAQLASNQVKNEGTRVGVAPDTPEVPKQLKVREAHGTTRTRSKHITSPVVHGGPIGHLDNEAVMHRALQAQDSARGNIWNAQGRKVL